MRKTLLFTIDFAPKTGGVANYYKNLCAHLPQEDIIVLTRPEKEDVEFDSNVKYKILRKNLIADYLWPKWLASFFHLRRTVKNEKIETILVGEILPLGTVAWVYKKLFKTPYVVFIHGMDLGMAKKKKRKYRLARKILEGADFIITNSLYTKKLVVQCGIEDKKIFAVYPGIERLDEMGAGNNQLTPEVETQDFASLRREKKILLTLGRLVKRKGHDMVIRSLPKILARYPNVIYVIAGDGPERIYLENLAKESGVEDEVIFVGEVKDKDKPYYYENCDIFVMPSRNIKGDVEGFGIVYLEAALYGRPVIAGNSGGSPEAALDGQTGLIVDSENLEEIADAVIRLLADSDYANKLGVQGKERVLKEFSWENQMRKFEKLLV